MFTEGEQKYWQHLDLDYALLKKILEDIDGEEGNRNQQTNMGTLSEAGNQQGDFS